MFKKRHSQPHISPLPSPASTNPNSAQYHTQPPPFQRPPQGPGGQDRMSMSMPQPYRQTSSTSSVSSPYPEAGPNQGSVRNRQSLQPPGRNGSGAQGEMEELRAGPPYPLSGGPNGHGPPQGQGQGYGGGPPVERVLSGDQKSQKSEKRRSGLFGFGRKKEDKKEKEREAEARNQATPRQSFNVTRTDSNNPHGPSGAPSGFPQQMHRFPTPGNGDPSLPPPVGQQGRIASNPSPRPGGGDFGPAPGNMPKSQSMGFSNQRVPDTHPYRGFLAGHPGEGQQGEPTHGPGRPQGLPKSTSMPFDKATPPTPTDRSPVPSAQSQGGPLVPSTSNDTARPTRERVLSAGSGRVSLGDQPEWMKEFAAVVELIGMQPQKTYVASPPELEMILARTSAGGQPKQGAPGSASNDWDAVWLQLSGISMSMWSMKETRAAAAKGDKVPPTYFNITDSSLELLAPLPPPPHRPKSHPHHHVFSLNTAGSNRLLFSCPSEPDIARWATGLRLAAWERARLEEIYTGHLIKSGGKEPRMDLIKGRMDGWVRVRVMGGTEWKRLWAVLSTPNPPAEPEEDKKTRRKSFFGLGGAGGGKDEQEVIQEPNTGQPMASFYNEPRSARNRSTAPVLTIVNVTQAYAVFPERLEVMSQSNLMKVVGKIGGELVAIESRLRDSGWVLIMPDGPEPGTGSPGVPEPTPLVNMMKWVTGVHDVFGLYGRPGRYSWDEKDPRSLFFAYPKGPERNRLFLEIDNALEADYRLSNLPQIRAQFAAILSKRGLPRPQSISRNGRQPSAERLYADDSDLTPPPRPQSNDYRLPPLSFDQAGSGGGSNPSPHLSQHSIPRSLSPITERTDPSRNNSQRTTNTDRQLSGSSSKQQQGSGSSKFMPAQAEEGGLETITDTSSSLGGVTEEPRQFTPTPAQPSVGAPTGTGSGIGGGVVHTSPQLASAESRTTFDSRAQTGDSIYSQNTSAAPTPARSGAASPVLANKASPSKAGVVAAGTAIAAAPAVAAALKPSAAPAGAPGHDTPPLAPPLGLGRPVRSASNSNSVSGDSERSIHSPTPRRVASTEFKKDKLITHDEQPTAQYLMHVVEEPMAATPPPPTAAALPPSSAPHPEAATAPAPGPNKDRLRPTIITDFSGPPKPLAAAHTGSSGGTTVPSAGKTNEPLGRKPSGARAPPPKKLSGRSNSARLDSVDDVQSPPGDPAPPVPAVPVPSNGHTRDRSATTATFEDIGEDASAYMAYADQPLSATYQSQAAVPAKEKEDDPHRSSFAPSKAAADRRAKAEAAAEEVQRVKNLPGGGKRGAAAVGQGAAGQTWSDEEDDEDEDEDEMDSPVVEKRGGGGEMGTLQRGQQEQSQGGNMGSIGRSGLRALPPVPRPQDERPSQPPQQQQQQRQPSAYMAGGDDYPQPSFPPDRPRTRSPAQNQYAQQPPPRPSSHSPAPYAPVPNMAPPAARQSIWNANFSAGHGMPASTSNKFVELEEPQAKLIQAFAPHGLLQAGMQDKEDRSAKKQEELAREMGSSLVNVPSKPPPPSAGLLGAVAQHEKERRNAGGIGATLTDREREKRLAEDRQREIERLQRQQAEHMRQFSEFQGGGGQAQGYGGYGMGMPSMGMGMGMPPMGFNPYQSGFNPYAQQQAMYAAQMAYQNAMMMSAAGSQAGGGGDDRPASPGGSQFGGYGGGVPGHRSPFQMPGWGMPMPSMPWMSPQPTGSPMMGHGMQGMGMGQYPSMHLGGQGQGQGSEYLHPPGNYGGGSGQASPAPQGEGRGRHDSFRSEGGAGAGAPAS